MAKLVNRCLLCGNVISLFREGLYDTRFGILGLFNLCRCNVCGLVQLSSSSIDSKLMSLYETFYNFGGEKNTAYTGFREYFFSSVLYRFWMIVDGDISFHNQKGSCRLMDVGCNEGRNLSIYQKNGFEVEGLELNKKAAAEARKCGHTVFTDPLESFQSKQPYDVVVLSNVLEHSLRPEEMLKHAYRIIKSGGEIWISCPNIESWQRKIFRKYWINWHVPFHIVHFSKNTLAMMLRDNGFEIREMRQESPALWMAQSIIVSLFAKPGKPTKQLRNLVLVCFLMLFIRGLFFPLLWIGNRLGRGDSLTVTAKKV